MEIKATKEPVEDFVLPAGEYFITDPCYIVAAEPEDIWTKFCDLLPEGREPCVIEVDGQKIWTASTAYGEQASVNPESPDLLAVLIDGIDPIAIDQFNDELDHDEMTPVMVAPANAEEFWRHTKYKLCRANKTSFVKVSSTSG
jgi:hypothetical protein